MFVLPTSPNYGISMQRDSFRLTEILTDDRPISININNQP